MKMLWAHLTLLAAVLACASAMGMGGIGPAWTRGEAERPLGEKNMGSYTAAVYTPEQQARLGVDEMGVKVEKTEDSTTVYLIEQTQCAEATLAAQYAAILEQALHAQVGTCASQGYTVAEGSKEVNAPVVGDVTLSLYKKASQRVESSAGAKLPFFIGTQETQHVQFARNHAPAMLSGATRPADHSRGECPFARCRRAARQLCHLARRSHRRAHQCMKQHLDQLPAECRAVVQYKDACRADMHRLCAGKHRRQRGQCMRDNESILSAGCREASQAVHNLMASTEAQTQNIVDLAVTSRVGTMRMGGAKFPLSGILAASAGFAVLVVAIAVLAAKFVNSRSSSGRVAETTPAVIVGEPVAC